MPAMTTWILTMALALSPSLGAGVPRRVDVNCGTDRALQHVLAKVAQLDEVDVYLDGVCSGNFVIATDGVTLRGASPGSGIAAPTGASDPGTVLEIVDAQVSLRGIVVQGGGAGVFVHGWNAEVLLVDVDVHAQSGVGVFASRGAQVRLLDSTVRDGSLGILAQSSATLNLQDVEVHDVEVGVTVFDASRAALNGSAIENNTGAGLSVGGRSDVNVVGGTFANNGQVHINANDWSRVSLLSGVAIGSDTDATPGALGANLGSRIQSFSTPAIYGNVDALNGASLALGNTVVHGDVIAIQFSNAFVRDSEVTGVVFCGDGAEAICRQTTTGGVVDCPSTTCGSPTAAAAPTPGAFEPPVVELPRPAEPRREPPRRPRSGPTGDR